MEREVPRYQLDCEIDVAGLEKSIDMLRELGGIDRAIAPHDLIVPSFQAASAID